MYLNLYRHCKSRRLEPDRYLYTKKTVSSYFTNQKNTTDNGTLDSDNAADTYITRKKKLLQTSQTSQKITDELIESNQTVNTHTKTAVRMHANLKHKIITTIITTLPCKEEPYLTS